MGLARESDTKKLIQNKVLSTLIENSMMMEGWLIQSDEVTEYFEEFTSWLSLKVQCRSAGLKSRKTL